MGRKYENKENKQAIVLPLVSCWNKLLFKARTAIVQRAPLVC
jgi:hypothetical protein